VVFSSELLKRIIVAIIIIPLLYIYVTKLSPIFFLLLLILATIVAQNEFLKMYKTKKSLSFIATVCGVSLILLLYYPNFYPLFLEIFIALTFMILSSVRLFNIKDPSLSLNHLAPAITSFFYIPFLIIPQWNLRLMGSEWIIFLYGCVWTSDSFAYFIGKGIGKRKLYEAISPKKTIEGAIGSIVGGIISALLLGNLMDMNVKSINLVFIGIAISASAIIGDLVESMFKRDAKVKDSGSFIPGHGGILDKIDGVLFAAPILYLYLLLFKIS
jgi:phosphatidate cytidylyltransferase